VRPERKLKRMLFAAAALAVLSIGAHARDHAGRMPVGRR
jgi:hypothetical protein